MNDNRRQWPLYVLSGGGVWLVLAVGEAVLLTTPLPEHVSNAALWGYIGGWAMIATWTGLVIGIATRLVYNVAVSNRRSRFAVETLFLLLALGSLIWAAVSMVLSASHEP